MKLSQYGRTAPITEEVFAEVSGFIITGKGVRINVIEREEGIDIAINPSGEPYKHLVRVHEVAASDAQVRVSGAHGAAL